jgi:hypothetical protein
MIQSQKLRVLQLMKVFLAFNESPNPTTVLTTALHKPENTSLKSFS